MVEDPGAIKNVFGDDSYCAARKVICWNFSRYVMDLLETLEMYL